MRGWVGRREGGWVGWRGKEVGGGGSEDKYNKINSG